MQVIQIPLQQFCFAIMYALFYNNLHDKGWYKYPGPRAGEVWCAAGGVSAVEIQQEEWNTGKAF